jgi:hypothetical protein
MRIVVVVVVVLDLVLAGLQGGARAVLHNQGGFGGTGITVRLLNCFSEI